MPNPLTLGVDFSSYGGPLSQATIERWKAAGVTFAIAQYSERLPQHLNALADGGLAADVYVYLYFPTSPWGQLPEERVRLTLNMIRGYDVGTVWLDVEDPNDSASPAQTIAALKRCVALVEGAGYKAGIYTGRYTWLDHVGQTTQFAHLPLWHADYTSVSPQADLTKRPTVLAFRGGAYGGWAAPTIWQWHNSTMFGGHSVDLNIKELDAPPAPPLEMEMENMQHVSISDEERGAAPFRSYMIGADRQGFGSFWVQGQDGFDAANLITGQVNVKTIALAELRAFKPLPDPLAP